jgi:hypothetical protein
LDNRYADHLAYIASSRASTPPDVIVERSFKSSVKSEESTSEEVGANLMVIDEPAHQVTYDWMSSMKAYLNKQLPSDDNTKVECILCKYRMYQLIDGVLYRQGTNGVMMMCISREEGIQLLKDIHKGVCGSHSSWRLIIEKAFRHGFYWPTAKDDVMEVVKKCKDCPFF